MMKNVATIWSQHFFWEVFEIPMFSFLWVNHIRIREDPGNEVDSLLSASERLNVPGWQIHIKGAWFLFF